MRIFYTVCLAALLFTTGCKSLLPVDNFNPHNKWKSYEEAHTAFERIVPHQTTVADLRVMGFDPLHSPNIKVLTYLDIIQRFSPNQSITKSDLPLDVLSCLEAKDGCRGFELIIEATTRKRFGSLPMDALGFKKNVHVTGWSFRALLIIQNDLVTYKLSSGEPRVNRYERKHKPLGPFQELEGLVTKLPGMI
jgi:hypothetical protein